MPEVVFGPAARAEVLEASDWYGAHSPALAANFVPEVESAAVVSPKIRAS